MKKTLLFISAFVAGLSGFAQLDTIPNESFDNWTSSEPNDWGSTNSAYTGFGQGGGVAQATGSDILNGSTLSLTTKVFSTYTLPATVISKGTFGLVGTTPAIAGGKEFRMRPVSLTFSAKYTSTSGSDNGVARVILTKWNGTSRDTVGIGVATVNNTVSSFATKTATIDYQNTGSTGTTVQAANFVGKKAVAPDSVQIIFSSSLPTGGVVGSTLFVDNLAFDYGCSMDDAIVTTGTTPGVLPASGAVFSATAGTTFSQSFTAYVPKNIMVSTFTVVLDSSQTTTAQLTGTASFLTVTPSWTNGMMGSDAVACFNVSGAIPPSATNTSYTFTITPLTWGVANGSIPLNATASTVPGTYTINVAAGGSVPPTSVESVDASGFGVSQNAPNPTSGLTSIEVVTPNAGQVTVTVIDLLGTVVSTQSINAKAGSNSITVDTDSFASGTYFYTVSNGSSSATKKLVVTK